MQPKEYLAEMNEDYFESCLEIREDLKSYLDTCTDFEKKIVFITINNMLDLDSSLEVKDYFAETDVSYYYPIHNDCDFRIKVEFKEENTIMYFKILDIDFGDIYERLDIDEPKPIQEYPHTVTDKLNTWIAINTTDEIIAECVREVIEAVYDYNLNHVTTKTFEMVLGGNVLEVGYDPYKELMENKELYDMLKQDTELFNKIMEGKIDKYKE